METDTDTIAIHTEKPDVNKLIEIFKRSGTSGDYLGRMEVAEHERLNWWENQSDDGRKWDKNMPEGQNAFPFNGASDSRVHQSDGIINELTALSTSAFWKSDLRVQPVGSEDMEEAARATQFMDWMINSKIRSQLEAEVELSAQYLNWYGWSGLHVTWDREICSKMKYVSMEELMESAMTLTEAFKAGQIDNEEDARIAEAMIKFPEFIQLEDTEEQAISLAKLLYPIYVKPYLPPQVPIEDLRPLSTKRAKKIVRDLRTEGRTCVPLPFLAVNQPCITALKPWRDIVLPSETTDLDGACAVFVREFLNEADLRAKALSNGWDEDWIEEAVKCKGRISVWNDTRSVSLSRQFQWAFNTEKNDLIEIVWAYVKQIDEDGVTGVYYTVFSPHFSSDANSGDNTLYAIHDLLDYPDTGYPIIPLVRERLDRVIMSSRGVPEIQLTDQREEKTQRDALCDLASIGVMPPVNVPRGAMGQRYKFGPAIQNEVTMGKEPKFMEVPTKGAPLALEFIKLIDLKIDRYWGRFSPDIHPGQAQLLMEPAVRRFLTAWSKALAKAYGLCVKFAPEMVERVTGVKPSSVDDINLGDFDFVFHFDVAQLNPDLMEQKLKSFSDLRLEDESGVIDKAKLVAFKARMIDPGLAKDLILDQTPASAKLFRDVQNDFAQMFLGNEVQYMDASNDPAAGAKMNYAMEILQKNPKYLQALDPQFVMQLIPNVPPQMLGASQPDPMFNAYVQKYFQNLQMGVQQQRNKIVGKTGVKQ